jgi:hypothetical protein
VVCILPAGGGAAVEVVSVLEGRVADRQRIALDTRNPSSREGCSGWEQVTASPDGRRLYLQSEHGCEGGLDRRATGLMTLLPGGERLDVQGVTTGSFTDVRVVRYREVAAPAAVAAEIAAAREGRAMAIDAARVHAAAPVGIAQVVEATRRLDPEVVEAWLVEREQPFAVDARQLVELADAGVNKRVIDLLVALSYPHRFAIDRGLRTGEMLPDEPGRAAPPRAYRPTFGLGPWLYDYGLGYRYGYRYGWSPGYYGYGYGGYPIVVVVRQPTDEQPGAQRTRAVPGRGYTRTQGSAAPSGSTPSTSRPSTSRPGSGSSGATPSSSAGSSSSSGSGSSGATRTARPRDN